VSKKVLLLPFPQKFFYFVEIHDTEKQLHAAASKLRGRRCDKDARAICLRYQYDGETLQGYKPLGTIFFTAVDSRNYSVVLHELTHAVIGYCNQIGLNPIKASRHHNSSEEKFVTLLQKTFEQYFKTLNANFNY
jgi:hypothetical protein